MIPQVSRATNSIRQASDTLLLAVDLMATFVFAVEGAAAGIQNDLDILGILVLSFATALGGGLIRDLLIGAVPPNAIRDWRYSATAFSGGAAIFFFYNSFRQIPPQLVTGLDAAGLALCAVAGAGKALAFEIHPFIAVLLGAVTGVGGGTIRDVLLAHVPTVLRADVYATAALAGAAVMTIGVKLGLSRGLMATLGAGVCFTLRMISVWQHWNLPRMIGH